MSARAIKHVDELARIASGDIKDENNDELGAAVLFVVGRGDAELFRPNVDGCASFARHLAAARDAGVRVLAHRVLWGQGEDLGKAFGGASFRSSCDSSSAWPRKEARVPVRRRRLRGKIHVQQRLEAFFFSFHSIHDMDTGGGGS